MGQKQSVAIETEQLELVQTVSDERLEVLVGGKGPGLLKTLTKSYPGTVSDVCVDVLVVSAYKHCE